MIIRLSANLARKLKEAPPGACPLADNPFTDWTARLFTAARTQYIMLTNTKALYTVVLRGAGITSVARLSTDAFNQLREALANDQMASLFERQVAPSLAPLRLAKSLSPSVTGSINEFVWHAKYILSDPERASWEAAHRLNRIPMGSLKYGFPLDVFRAMPAQGSG